MLTPKSEFVEHNKWVKKSSEKYGMREKRHKGSIQQRRLEDKVK